MFSVDKFFLGIYRVGASVIRNFAGMPTSMMVFIYLSFITTLTANLMSFIASKKGTRYSHTYAMFLDTTIFLSILNQVTLTKMNCKNLTLLANCLLEPFKKYAKHTRQFKIIRQYKKRVAICALVMAVFNSVGSFFHSLDPLLAVYWSSNNETIEQWPLPLGKVPMKVYSGWFYGTFYFFSFTCVLVSNLSYVCWFLIMVCSTFHMMTKLKLLSLEVKALSARAEELCEYRLSFCSRQQRKILREECINIYSLACLTAVVKEHITIIKHVRLLENSYRWIILGYSKAAIFITALSLMIMIDEWKVEGSISTVRINMTMSTLFFIFINSYSGQTIINESENLRLAFCDINWMNKSTRFANSFKIVMAATQKPLQLTAGTVFVLSMESYSKTMEAVYSFVNFLIPLRR